MLSDVWQKSYTTGDFNLTYQVQLIIKMIVNKLVERSSDHFLLALSELDQTNSKQKQILLRIAVWSDETEKVHLILPRIIGLQLFLLVMKTALVDVVAFGTPYVLLDMVRERGVDNYMWVPQLLHLATLYCSMSSFTLIKCLATRQTTLLSYTLSKLCISWVSKSFRVIVVVINFSILNKILFWLLIIGNQPSNLANISLF